MSTQTKNIKLTAPLETFPSIAIRLFKAFFIWNYQNKMKIENSAGNCVTNRI